MEAVRRRERLLFSRELREDCHRRLRSLELSAYAGFMNAVRASGGIDEPKREMMSTIQRWFRIPDWRHQAETRRVAMDERLTVIADTIVGEYTADDWLQESYDHTVGDQGPVIAPRLSDHDVLLKVIERRLIASGVVVNSDEEEDPDPEKLEEKMKEIKELLPPGWEKLKQKHPTVTPADPEVLKKLSEQAESTPTVALNFESDDEELFPGKKRRESSPERSESPDIHAESQRRRKVAIEGLTARLSFTSSPDIAREKRVAGREKRIAERESSLARDAKLGQGKSVISAALAQDEKERAKREPSEASSCFSATEAVEQIIQMMTKPKSGRGRGVGKGRGRGQSTTRGRGRGRGRSVAPTHGIPWPNQMPPQFPQPEKHSPNDATPSSSSQTSRDQLSDKVTANGEEIKKRTPYKRKKQVFQPVATEPAQNESITGREAQKPSQLSPPPIRRDWIGPNNFQQSFRGNNQYYDSQNEIHHPPASQSYNSNTSYNSPYHDQPQNSESDIPPKIRHKTKHATLIQDRYEKIPPPPTSATNTPQFVDYNNEPSQRRPPSSSFPTPHLLNSVIVRTPTISQPQPSSTTPPKIINPMSKTHITITNPKPSVNHSTSTYRSPTETPKLIPPPYKSSTVVPSLAYKKRTQNLAAATTYTPLADSQSYSASESSVETGHLTSQQTPNTASANAPASSNSASVITATASSLAARSRPTPYEFKTSVSSASATPTSLPALTSSVRAPSTSITPVVQRKAQPHILAGSKNRNNNANAASNSAAVTPASGGTTPSTTSVTTSVIQTLPGGSALTGTQVTSVPVVQNLPVIGGGSSTPVNVTRGPGGVNIVYVKNPNAVLPGQAIMSPSLPPGAVQVRGSGKAVILRRANNSNLMILDMPKNYGTGSPVTQYLGARLQSVPQNVAQISTGLSGSPIRQIIQTSGGRILASTSSIITSASSSPIRSKLVTLQSGNGAIGNANQPITTPAVNQVLRPPLKSPATATVQISSPAQGLTRASTPSVTSPHRNTVPVSTTGNNTVTNHDSSTETITASEGEEDEINLLSNEVMMECSPPPIDHEEGESEVELESENESRPSVTEASEMETGESEDDSPTIAESSRVQFNSETSNTTPRPTNYPKTRITIVSGVEDSPGQRDSPILSQVLTAKRPYQVQENQYEEDSDDDLLNSSLTSTTSQSSSQEEVEEPPEEGNIELIDIADSADEESVLSESEKAEPVENANCITTGEKADENTSIVKIPAVETNEHEIVLASKNTNS